MHKVRYGELSSVVSVWDHLVLKAEVRVIMACWIIFDDQQQEKGAGPFSVRQNLLCWTDGISVFPSRHSIDHAWTKAISGNN